MRQGTVGTASRIARAQDGWIAQSLDAARGRGDGEGMGDGEGKPAQVGVVVRARARAHAHARTHTHTHTHMQEGAPRAPLNENSRSWNVTRNRFAVLALGSS
jgi:hypothetical protein